MIVDPQLGFLKITEPPQETAEKEDTQADEKGGPGRAKNLGGNHTGVTTSFL
jgi:hypothetical protein